MAHSFYRVHHFLKVLASLICVVVYGLIISGTWSHSQGKNVFKVM